MDTENSNTEAGQTAVPDAAKSLSVAEPPSATEPSPAKPLEQTSGSFWQSVPTYLILSLIPFFIGAASLYDLVTSCYSNRNDPNSSVVGMSGMVYVFTVAPFFMMAVILSIVGATRVAKSKKLILAILAIFYIFATVAGLFLPLIAGGQL